LNFKKIDDAINMLCGWFSYVGALLTFVLMVIIFIDVAGRVFFNKPFAGTAEVAREAVVVIAFSMFSWAAFQRRHVRSTMVVAKLPATMGKIVDITSYLIGFSAFIVIIYSNWGPAIESIVDMEFEGEGALRIPTFPTYWVILLGSVLMAWQCLRSAYISLKRGTDFSENKKPEEVIG
jgi:TRAP-type C4-dicarboxylate transport system permease small subunit